jgi:uncharacterized protein
MVFTSSIRQNFIHNSYLIFISFLVIAIYLPVALIWTGIIPFQYRFAVMFCILGIMISYIHLRKFRWSDLGFRRDTLKNSLMWNLIISLLFLSLLGLLYGMGLLERTTMPFWPFFFIFYVLILTPIQELFFRSILFAEMRNIRHKYHWAIIALSSLSFCFLHVIYRHPFMLLVTLFMGLIWSIIYYKYPNFWGVAFSHAALGIAAFSVGLI